MPRFSIIVVALTGLTALACTSVAPGVAPITSQVAVAGLPIVSLSSPANGAVVPLGAPVAVVATASDNSGVSRIDLTVNGVVVDTYSTAGAVGQPSIAAQLAWTPSVPGAHALAVIAYRPDGTPSLPAVVAVSVADAATVTLAPVTSSEPSLAPTTAPVATVDAPTPTADLPTSPPDVATAPPTSRPTRRPRPTATATATATAEPVDIDLYATNVTFTEHTNDPVAGYHIDVFVTITNAGTDRARRFSVEMTCLGYSYSQDVYGLEPGESYDAGFGFYESVASEGKNYVVSFVDSTNRVEETDEDNNDSHFADTPGSYCVRATAP